MTPDERRRALLTVIAAKLELEIADQHLKRSAVMRNANTLRRILSGRDCRLSRLMEAAEGANCEIEIIIRRKTAA